MTRRQEYQKERYDTHSREKSVTEGSEVLIRDFLASKSKWMKGVIKGEVACTIEMEDGRIIRRHLDHIKPYLAADRNSEDIERQDDNSIRYQIRFL